MQQFLTHNGINQYIDEIFGDVGLFGKAASITKALKKINIPKAESIYIGDEVRDIEASKKVGIKVVAVDWGFNTKNRLKKANPDYLISKPQEIMKLIK